MTPEQMRLADSIVVTKARPTDPKYADLNHQQQRIIRRIRVTVRPFDIEHLHANTFEVAALFPGWDTVERDIRWHFRGVDPKAFIRAVLLAPRLAQSAYALVDSGEKDIAEVYFDDADACLYLRDRASRPLVDLTGLLDLIDLPIDTDPHPVPEIPDTLLDPSALIVDTLSAAPRPAPLCRV